MRFDSREHGEFFHELKQDGYHILSRSRAAEAGFYPNTFRPFPRIALEDIQENQTITIRAFFATGDKQQPNVESGIISVEVEYVDRETQSVFANIVTTLPSRFAIAKGTTIELSVDEILSIEDD